MGTPSCSCITGHALPSKLSGKPKLTKARYINAISNATKIFLSYIVIVKLLHYCQIMSIDTATLGKNCVILPKNLPLTKGQFCCIIYLVKFAFVANCWLVKTQLNKIATW